MNFTSEVQELLYVPEVEEKIILSNMYILSKDIPELQNQTAQLLLAARTMDIHLSTAKEKYSLVVNQA